MHYPFLEVNAQIIHKDQPKGVRVYAIGERKIEEYKGAEEGDIISLTFYKNLIVIEDFKVGSLTGPVAKKFIIFNGVPTMWTFLEIM